MSKPFFEEVIRQHLISSQIPNKEELFWDIHHIQHNITGRADVFIANNFILESSQMLLNSIILFEQGFFDCAYYSLRQAIELSTTMTYLSDMPIEIQKRKLRDWNNEDNFPLQSQMLKELKEKGNIFSDMKQKMPHFFEKLHNNYTKLNKLVHKQGKDKFYRNKFIYNFDKTKHIEEFLSYLKQTIGIVAVMRLAIDPFPILLSDEEIYHRSFKSLSEAYPDDFIDKYIGNDTVNEYKQTKLFQETYRHIMTFEKRSSCVSDIVWNQFIDLNQKEEILKQLHLVSTIDKIVIYLAFMCRTTTKIYTLGGLCWYYTSLVASNLLCDNSINSSAEFDKYCKSSVKYNQHFNNMYLSAFQYHDNDFLVEHFTPLLEKEIRKINQFLISENENKEL